MRARLWVRNGDEVRRLAGVYGGRFWASLGRDADLALLQMALAAALDPHAIATRLLRLGGSHCVSPVPEPPPPAEDDGGFGVRPWAPAAAPPRRFYTSAPHKAPERALECTRSAARTLVGLARERGRALHTYIIPATSSTTF